MFKMLCMLAGCLFASLCYAQQTSTPESREGIWEETQNPGRYYSLHEENNMLVLINIDGIARHANPLRWAYTGSTQQGVSGAADSFSLNRINPDTTTIDSLNNKITIRFNSAADAEIVRNCGCPGSLLFVPLRKIF